MVFLVHAAERDRLTLAHRLPGRAMVDQRALDDVLVRINYRDGRPPVVQYASKGRAEYALERYSRAEFLNRPTLPMWVERVAS